MSNRKAQEVFQVFLTSIVLGVVCFGVSFFCLLSIGFNIGVLKIVVFGPPQQPGSLEMAWTLVVWVGSTSFALLSSYAFFHLVKRHFL
ncbi:MAG TPA: hypothetical protein VNY24_14880 [Candidatus Acidoferrales bacterium]|nr:hypothetical protein [Candidatus Acidoferrales bacterium]